MGEKEAIKVLKERGMSQSEAEGFVGGVKRGLQAKREGRVKEWIKISTELTGGGCPGCDKK
ncbi:hypothetical protein ES703_100846 [subsurface metagenome]